MICTWREWSRQDSTYFGSHKHSQVIEVTPIETVYVPNAKPIDNFWVDVLDQSLEDALKTLKKIVSTFISRCLKSEKIWCQRQTPSAIYIMKSPQSPRTAIKPVGAVQEDISVLFGSKDRIRTTDIFLERGDKVPLL